MGYKIIVLAKQVPDTHNVGPDAMTPDGKVNRAALPAVFNPEDLNALEQALRIKDAHPGTTITVLTMGLPKAADVLRESLYRGADEAVLLTDRALGGADTLATSYSLAQTIRTKLSGFDIILCGRQAIDGDTAQVGPQVAEKLGLPQVTYAEEILTLEGRKTTIRRHIDGGVETVEAPLPLVVTVNGSAAPCRSRNAKLVMKHKRAKTDKEIEALADDAQKAFYAARPYLAIHQYGAADIAADLEQIGMKGSPTMVKTVKSIVFTAKESKKLSGSDADIDSLMGELIANSTIG